LRRCLATGILANQKAGIGEQNGKETRDLVHCRRSERLAGMVKMSKYRTIATPPSSKVGKTISDPRARYESITGADVNLSIKVPRQLRQHWAAEAKRQGTTLTAVIMDALNKRFGGP
jgi:hypothetical protein